MMATEHGGKHFKPVHVQEWIHVDENQASLLLKLPLTCVDKKVEQLEKQLKNVNMLWGQDRSDMIDKLKASRFAHDEQLRKSDEEYKGQINELESNYDREYMNAKRLGHKLEQTEKTLQETEEKLRLMESDYIILDEKYETALKDKKRLELALKKTRETVTALQNAARAGRGQLASRGRASVDQPEGGAPMEIDQPESSHLKKKKVQLSALVEEDELIAGTKSPSPKRRILVQDSQPAPEPAAPKTPEDQADTVPATPSDSEISSIESAAADLEIDREAMP